MEGTNRLFNPGGLAAFEVGAGVILTKIKFAPRLEFLYASPRRCLILDVAAHVENCSLIRIYIRIYIVQFDLQLTIFTYLTQPYQNLSFFNTYLEYIMLKKTLNFSSILQLHFNQYSDCFEDI